MTFNGDATLSGNALTLTGDVTLASSSPHLTWNLDVRLGTNVFFGQYGANTFNGAIDVNGKTLTFRTGVTVNALNGSGTVTAPGLSGLYLTGSGTFSGTIVDTGVVLEGASIPNAAAGGQFGGVSGHGTIGDVTVGGSGGIAPDGVLHTKTITVASSSVGMGFHLNPGSIRSSPGDWDGDAERERVALFPRPRTVARAVVHDHRQRRYRSGERNICRSAGRIDPDDAFGREDDGQLSRRRRQ
jgi:hypothetical protein